MMSKAQRVLSAIAGTVLVAATAQAGSPGTSDCSYSLWAAHDPHHYGRNEAKAALEHILKGTNR